jgi:hypothetical protein
VATRRALKLAYPGGQPFDPSPQLEPRRPFFETIETILVMRPAGDAALFHEDQPLQAGVVHGVLDGGAGRSTNPSERPTYQSLRTHVATLKEQLATAEARLAAANAKTEQTEQGIAAFSALAERLDALAARARPWWRRLAG